MLGALAGDIIGSRFEHANIKRKDFALFHPECTFTDDSVLSIALAESLLDQQDFAGTLRRYYQDYPHAGYGGYFHRWAQDSGMGPYNSFGNGSAMRTSPVGWYYDDLEQALAAAQDQAAVTHDHPEGIKGAQAVVAAIQLARQGKSKKEIKADIQWRCGYDLQRRLDDIRPNYVFDVTCQGSVPEAIIAFLEAQNFEDAIRNAISLGGDSDTIACITGSIAEAFFSGVPSAITQEVFKRLDPALAEVTQRFYREVVEPKL